MTWLAAIGVSIALMFSAIVGGVAGLLKTPSTFIPAIEPQPSRQPTPPSPNNAEVTPLSSPVPQLPLRATLDIEPPNPTVNQPVSISGTTDPQYTSGYIGLVILGPNYTGETNYDGLSNALLNTGDLIAQSNGKWYGGRTSFAQPGKYAVFVISADDPSSEIIASSTLIVTP